MGVLGKRTAQKINAEASIQFYEYLNPNYSYKAAINGASVSLLKDKSDVLPCQERHSFSEDTGLFKIRSLYPNCIKTHYCKVFHDGITLCS
jgi:hypothetical protein